ncbi:MAG: 6-bladed beta-propeller [Balneola sp.]
MSLVRALFTTKIVCIIFFLSFCSKEIKENSETLSQAQLNEDVIELNLKDSILDTVYLHQEVIYESNDKVFIEGNIWDFDIDNKNNVHIASTGPGLASVYSFDAKGKYLGKMGSFGRGPGEFEAISSILVNDEKLVVLDSRLRRISVFSLATFELISDEVINTDQVNKLDVFASLMKARTIYGQYKNELLISFWPSNFYDLNKFTNERIYLVSKSGIVQNNEPIEFERYSFFNATGFNQNISGSIGPFTTPFTRTSRIAFSNKGVIYKVWSENFLIEKYSIDEGYIGSYYFPYMNSKLLLSEADLSDRRKEQIIEEGKPETWPAVYTLEIDDNDLLWVATITDSDSTYQWYVLTGDGEVKAGFTTQGKKKKNFIGKKPLIKIRDGFFYKHERNYDEGIDRIVKYKIEFKKRE